MHKRIDSVLLKSCTQLTVSEQAKQLAMIHNQHWRVCGDMPVFEYPARVKNYAERHRLENNKLGMQYLERTWNSVGFGFYVELCGYP